MYSIHHLHSNKVLYLTKYYFLSAKHFVQAFTKPVTVNLI
jgi:hypothetical protein